MTLPAVTKNGVLAYLTNSNTQIHEAKYTINECSIIILFNFRFSGMRNSLMAAKQLATG